MGRREMAEMAVNWIRIGKFVRLEFWLASSEKGNTRKHTENRVTSWRKMFRGNFGVLR
jgi:hypothetical protein